MTPVSLNPPPANSSHPLISHQIHHQHHLFISPNNQPSFHTFFSTPSILDQRRIEQSPFDQECYESVVHGGSSNHQGYSASEDQPFIMDDLLKSNRMKDKEISKSSHGYAAESSKMRLLRRMMTTPADSSAAAFQNQNQQHAAENSQRISPSNTTRVCSDCNTTSTPLWRSGPKGPKSLCNACGIRKRKARRAMAEAVAASMDIASSNSTNSKTRAHNKGKKPRTNHLGEFKSKGKTTIVAAAITSGLEREPAFKDLALSFSNDQAFPDDEVTAAAQLLMELSCGFLHI